MKPKNQSGRPAKDDGRPLDRRQFERIELASTAFAVDANGNELGRVVEISGGGFLLKPATPFARISLAMGARLVITIVEPANVKQTSLNVEVRRVLSDSIGLRFV